MGNLGTKLNILFLFPTGNLENYGTNIRGITSAGNQSESNPSSVPKWYYMADDWKCSLCDDTIVRCITGK